jgi:hypothetical protein
LLNIAVRIIVEGRDAEIDIGISIKGAASQLVKISCCEPVGGIILKIIFTDLQVSGAFPGGTIDIPVKLRTGILLACDNIRCLIISEFKPEPAAGITLYKSLVYS